MPTYVITIETIFFANSFPFVNIKSLKLGVMKSNTFADIFGRRQHQWMLMSVFSVDLVCKEEINLMQKVSLTSSQGAVGLS